MYKVLINVDLLSMVRMNENSVNEMMMYCSAAAAMLNFKAASPVEEEQLRTSEEMAVEDCDSHATSEDDSQEGTTSPHAKRAKTENTTDSSITLTETTQENSKVVHISRQWAFRMLHDSSLSAPCNHDVACPHGR